MHWARLRGLVRQALELEKKYKYLSIQFIQRHLRTGYLLSEVVYNGVLTHTHLSVSIKGEREVIKKMSINRELIRKRLRDLGWTQLDFMYELRKAGLEIRSVTTIARWLSPRAKEPFSAPTAEIIAKLLSVQTTQLSTER